MLFLKLEAKVVMLIPPMLRCHLFHFLLKKSTRLADRLIHATPITGNSSYFPVCGPSFTKIYKSNYCTSDFNSKSIQNKLNSIELVFRGSNTNSTQSNLPNSIIHYVNPKDKIGEKDYAVTADLGVLSQYVGLSSGPYNLAAPKNIIFLIGNENLKAGDKFSSTIKKCKQKNSSIQLFSLYHKSLEPNIQLGSSTMAIIWASKAAKSVVVRGLNQMIDSNVEYSYSNFLKILKYNLHHLQQALFVAYYCERLKNEMDLVLEDSQVSHLFNSFTQFNVERWLYD